MKLGNGNIESIDINKITEKDILTMYEIERDTWAFFMGEYVKCNNCNISYSKKDIYLCKDKNYNLKTVCELEKEYGRNNIKCNCCGGNTVDIRGEELIKILESRIFSSKKGFVNFYKSSVDKVLGFSYGFIDSPEKTYEREFSYHFSEKLLEDFIKNFGNKDLLTLSGVCIIEKEKSIHKIYELIKYFYCSLDSKYNDIIGIGESIKGTHSYKIYKKMLPNSINFNNKTNYILNDFSKVQPEILYGEKLVKKVKKITNMNITEFLIYTRNGNLL